MIIQHYNISLNINNLKTINKNLKNIKWYLIYFLSTTLQESSSAIFCNIRGRVTLKNYKKF